MLRINNPRCLSVCRRALVFWLYLCAGVLQCAAQNNTQTNLASYADFALRTEGVVARGKILFNNEQKTMCMKCHTVDGSSSKAGPDLSFIGDKFPRRDLITAVLEPSAAIAIGYDATTIATKSHDEYTGVIKQANDSYIGLMGADGQLVRIPAAEIV